MLPFFRLAKEGEKNNLNIRTIENGDYLLFDIIVFVDLPNKFDYERIKKIRKMKYLILLESKHVMPNGYNMEYHHLFEKIFTWDEDLIDNEKYFKINYSFQFPIVENIEFQSIKRINKIVTISGNKKSTDPFELYSMRENIIKFYEEKGDDFLDLYGIGWDERVFKNSFMNRISRKVKCIRTSFYIPYLSYKGPVERKSDVLKKYRFCLCLENRYGDYGYITEKIFDAMISGCIPIYFGAKDICKHIPKNCFIDLSIFSDYQELDIVLKSLTSSQIKEYQENIKCFLSSEKIYPFSIDCFVTTLIGNFNE